MLNMIRKVFFGPVNGITENATDIRINEKLALGVIVIIIFWLGVYPQCVLEQTAATTESITQKFAAIIQKLSAK
jgi:NADH-quinone oxidoreductase subunit M